MAKTVLVLGGTGMLGSMVVDVLAREPGLQVKATARDKVLLEQFSGRAPEVSWTLFDALQDNEGALAGVVAGAEWIVNAIGLTKPLIHEDRPEEVERAVRVNALFPHLLARAATRAGGTVLQIATDCVYAGRSGGYAEDSNHDALDAYGKTKSLGETPAPCMRHLRTSIIGPEPKDAKFLLEWFLGQPSGAQVNGFTHHRWNGVTTLQFARVCCGVILRNVPLPGRHHLVPSDTVQKCELLGIFSEVFERRDVSIEPAEIGPPVDRTLTTQQEAANRRIWGAAGYAEPPSIRSMVQELSGFDYRFARA